MSQAQTASPEPQTAPGHDVRLGYFYGFVGVASFSLTLPATRVAVTALAQLSALFRLGDA
jgi:hypothetical protein